MMKNDSGSDYSGSEDIMNTLKKNCQTEFTKSTLQKESRRSRNKTEWKCTIRYRKTWSFKQSYQKWNFFLLFFEKN